MSSTEDRPGGADDPLDADSRDAGTPPPAPPDAPTQVGIPVPTPARGRPAATPPAAGTPRGYAAVPPVTTPPGNRDAKAAAPPSAEGRPSATVIAILVLLLIVALAVAGVLAFNVFGPPPAPDPTTSPRPALTPATPAATADGISPGATLAGGPSPAPGDASPRTPDVTTTPAATDPQARLLGHVPPDLRDSCDLGPGTPPALAIATCQADDGTILATYFLYDDRDVMNAAYDGFADVSGVERDSGRCSEPETWPSEGSYSVQDEPAGRVLCMQISDAPTIYWTDARLLILTWAVHVNGDAERLYEFWEREAGPSR